MNLMISFNQCAKEVVQNIQITFPNILWQMEVISIGLKIYTTWNIHETKQSY